MRRGTVSCRAGDTGADARAQVLQQVAAADSREAADEAAVAFCFVGGKAARKRLVRCADLSYIRAVVLSTPGEQEACAQVRLLTLESTAAIHQLPFHARILATLAAVFPDVGVQALQHLEADFSRLQVRSHSAVWRSKFVCWRQ